MKTKKTTWDHVAAGKCDEREYVVIRQGLQRPSSNYSVIRCPFCSAETKAFWWSLSGGGKRCECGAMFSSRGLAYRLKDEKNEVKP
jgi:hypothetical protein